uniref:Syndecan/Neurexin domain-containing protein n=1 Tax=Octopus bimaculoides TaxID=37653 RepID=A0A0L8HBL1_OCTBM
MATTTAIVVVVVLLVVLVMNDDNDSNDDDGDDDDDEGGGDDERWVVVLGTNDHTDDSDIDDDDDEDEYDRVTMPSLIVSTWKTPNSRNYATEMGKKPHANETNQQREEYPALVSIWTIYIIVGSVSGGVLFIGLITIIVAVCCQKENTGTYKSTNV